MRKAMQSTLRVAALFGLMGGAGCFPAYEPSGPSNEMPEKEPDISATATSNEPVAVSPLNPIDDSTIWLDAGDAALIAQRATEEGPIEVASRRHACMKVKYETIGRLLHSRGALRDNANNQIALPVTLATNCATFRLDPISNQEYQFNDAPIGNEPPQNAFAVDPVTGVRLRTGRTQTAAYIYCQDRTTLGFPQYESRLAEATSATTASSTKLLDLFISAAPEIIANIGNKAECRDASNNPAVLFERIDTSQPESQTNVRCVESGVTCIQGYPATQDQLDLCTRIIRQAVRTRSVILRPSNFTVPGVSALDNGKRIAVASILSAAHSCE